MSKYNEHITDEMSELIALEMMLGDDMDSQNLLDMEAQFAYSQPMEAAINIDKEIELISRLQKAIKPNFWAAFIKYFIGISIVIYGVSLFINRHGNNNNLLPQNNNNNGEKLSTIAGKPKDTSNTNTKKTHNWLTNKKEEKQHIADSVSKEKEQNKTAQYTTSSSGAPMPAIKMPKHKAQEADYLPVKEPSFSNFQYSSKDYIKQELNFDLKMVTNYDVELEQKNAKLTYYTGNPLKKSAGSFVYVNYGQWCAYRPGNIRNKNKNVLPEDSLIEGKQKNRHLLKVPYAIRMHVDTSKIYANNKGLLIREIPASVLESCIVPFFMKQDEVSNSEYLEFSNWVREANGYKSVVEAKADFAKAYTYTFFNPNNQVRESLPSNKVMIYPDTTCWTKDFTKGHFEPMVDNYFWHSAYSSHPVVGVNYWQVLAFLDWKTHFHQLELNKTGVKYEVEYALPTDIQWELACTMSKCDEKSDLNFSATDAIDKDWITDLLTNVEDSTGEFHSSLRYCMNRNSLYQGNYLTDGSALTDFVTPLYMPNGSNHVTSANLFFLDGNTSEWMQETYKDNWSPIFIKHLSQINLQKGKEVSIVKAIEELYNQYNNPNGQLIRGANWFDERFGSKATGIGYSKTSNVAGTNVKRFIDPNEQHSTLGFRYVVKFKIVE